MLSVIAGDNTKTKKVHMKKFLLLPFCSVLLFAPFTSTAHNKVIPLNKFSGICIEGLIEATIKSGSKNGVTLTGEAADLQHMVADTETEAECLHLVYTPQLTQHITTCNCLCFSIGSAVTTTRAQQSAVKALITTTSMLKMLDLEKASTANVECNIDTPTIRISTAGTAHAVLGTVKAKDSFTISSADESTVSIASVQALAKLNVGLRDSAKATCTAGHAKTLTLSAEGSGELDAAQLTAEGAYVDASGSSNATLHVSKNLNAKASGSANVRYSGTPTVETNLSDTARVEKI